MTYIKTLKSKSAFLIVHSIGMVIQDISYWQYQKIKIKILKIGISKLLMVYSIRNR